MPRIADYLTLWDTSFELHGTDDHEDTEFTVPSDTNLSKPTVLLFNLGVYSYNHETISLSFKISINNTEVYSWSVNGCGIQILTSSHHEVISSQVLHHGTNPRNRINVECVAPADSNCYMKFSDVVLMFQRDI